MDSEAMGVPKDRGTLIHTDSWYAIYTKHQHEKNVADLLQRKGFEVFLPLVNKKRRWKDRVKQVSFPMFPCYVFIRGIADRKIEVLQVSGVFWFVESAGRACAIPDSEMQCIRKVADAGVKVEAHPYLSCGTTVRVTRGALEGLTGILIRLKNENRVVVSLKPLQKAISVEVDRTDLERVWLEQEDHLGPAEAHLSV